MVAVTARESAVAAEQVKACIADAGADTADTADTRPLWVPAHTHTRRRERPVLGHRWPSAAAS